MAPFRVLVIYPYLQHYRFGVFREMDNTPGVEYTFISDLQGRGGIKSLSPDSVSRHIFTPRKEVGPFSWQKGLLPILWKESFDAVIIFAEIPSITTWMGTLIARVRNKPVYFWTTGWHRPDSGIKRIARNAFFHLSTKLLLYGNIGKTIGTEMRFPIEKMEVIGNSVESPPTSLTPTMEWNFERSEDTAVIGAIIRLIPSKKLDQLIQAVALINNANNSPKIALLIVGEGPEREKLETLAHELGVDLSLPGAVYDEKVINSIYELMDVTVVPGAIGLTAVQSLAHSVPVISNGSIYAQGPEWEAIKNGKTGWLFEEDNLLDLVDKIQYFLSRPESHKRQIAENCRKEYNENWTAKAQANRIFQAISGNMTA